MRQSITGNTTFIKKTVLPMTKQAGIKKVSVKILPAQLPDDKERMEVSFDTDKETNNKLLDLLKKKAGKKGATKRKKLNLTVYNEANASVIRKKLLKQFGGDPLYRDFILAKTPKEQRKALDTLKSIRGDVGVRLMQKYVKKLQAESVTDVKAILNENPAAAAAAAMTTVMLMNKETGRKNKAISALRDKDNPSHGKAVGIFKRLKDKFAKSKGKKDFEKQKKAVSKGAADYIRKLDKESVDESGILYRAGVKKYGKEGMRKIQQAAGKRKSHAEIGKIKDKYEKDKKESINESAVSFWQDMFRPGPIPKQYINQLIKKKGELPSKSHIKRIYKDNGNPNSKDLEGAWKGLVKDKYVRAASGMWRWNADFTGW